MDTLTALTATEFAALYDTHAPALARFFGRQQLDEHAADLVQEVFARAWAARIHFQPGTNARAWLYRIAHNLVVDHWRRQRPQVAWHRLERWHPADDVPTPEEVAVRNERRDAVHRALARLTVRQRRHLWAQVILGVSSRSRPAVKAAVYEGRQRFRLQFRRVYHEDDRQR
jgi:RNA polymerase sigma-70 factor (ECF subfamily)